MELYVGIMSGTSVDGVDSVLVSFENKTFEIIDCHTQNFPDEIKEEILELLKTFTIHLKQLGELDHKLGLCYADCVNNLLTKTNVSPKNVLAIGCHGQTIFHQPGSKYPFSMQVGDGNLIAAHTGITTINDFRRMDMAFGGEGAPLAPVFHKEFFYSSSENRVVLNLGGIANITVLNKKRLMGWDTGPANCLIDWWIQKNKKEKFDCGGAWGRSGTISNELLQEFLDEAYFTLEIPKSTGKELFNESWLTKKLEQVSSRLNAEDIQATLTELTAKTVTDSILKYAADVETVFVCGGGAYNSYLLERLAMYLPGVKISTTEELGLPVQLVEATAFAWLARQRLKMNTGNCPSVTGARSSVVLGASYGKGMRH